MPVQQQMSSFAGRLGAKVAEANAEHRGKPIDTGNRRLPGGISEKVGRAKVQAAYTKEQTEDKGACPKGETFFRISAAVISPKEHNGVKCEGIITSQIIPLCDIPAKVGQGYESKAVSFSENWNKFRGLFVTLGFPEPAGPQYDVTPQMSEAQKNAIGQNIQAYYFAAMKALVDPSRPPTIIAFSTRSWKPDRRKDETEQQYKDREPIVIENWHGLADTAPHDPAASVTQSTNGQAHSEPFEEPPQGVVNMPDGSTQESVDITDEVTGLVEVAMSDPNGDTEDGTNAAARLEDLAFANGWTKEQTSSAADWAAVGDMALNKPKSSPPPAVAPSGGTTTISVGYKAKFAKRTKDGAKLKNSKGIELPPSDVEVTSVNTEAKTCTVKTVKDGKDVVDLRSKQPVQVKWEWLE